MPEATLKRLMAVTLLVCIVVLLILTLSEPYAEHVEPRMFAEGVLLTVCVVVSLIITLFET